MSSTLIFAYNADSGLFNALTEMAHKIFSPNTYPCRLCALTYGNFGMRREWQDFLDRLSTQVKFLHADELKGRCGVEAVALPAVFMEQGGELEVLIHKDALDACQTLADLKSLVVDSVKGEQVLQQLG
jgi:hypothetical protein